MGEPGSVAHPHDQPDMGRVPGVPGGGDRADIAIAQVALGIWTLLWAVPLWLGLAHQGGALVVLAAAIWNLHCELKGERVAALRTVRAS